MKMQLGKIFLSLLFATTLATAQNKLKITSGGFGHFSCGPTFIDASFANNLITSSNLGQESFNLGSIGLLYGGEGFGLRNRWFYGGGGFALYLPSSETNKGSLNLGMGGGYFKAGYILLQKTKSLTYCYGSIGGGEWNVTIKNRSENNLEINNQTFVSPYTTNKYKISALFFDAGAGTKILVTPDIEDANKTGGLILGVDAGCKISTPVGNWQVKSTDVHITARPTQFMPYVRLTLGGGIFNRK